MHDVFDIILILFDGIMLVRSINQKHKQTKTIIGEADRIGNANPSRIQNMFCSRQNLNVSNSQYQPFG